MWKSSYTKTDSKSSSTEFLTSGTFSEREHSSSIHDIPRLGRPQAKPLFDTLDALIVSASLLCHAISICIVTPTLSLSWRLGFNGQIVAIGLLLGVMNLCLRRVTPTLFIHMEARWGDSVLQNYNSILRNTPTLSHTSYSWRLTMVTLTVLPLGLSAAYKRFTGGTSTITLHTPGSQSQIHGHYALSPPPMGSFSTLSNSIYLAINASAEFVAASSNKSNRLTPSDLPRAYGFNTLLLDDHSAALLDIPDPAYVTAIQNALSTDETWTVKASVNATVARMDVTFVNQQDNDEFWTKTWKQSTNFGYLSSALLYQLNSTTIGMMLGTRSNATMGPYCVIGFYGGGSVDGIDQFKRDDSPDALLFRESSPWKFDMRRERCTGTWRIGKQTMSLVDGECPGHAVNQSVFGAGIPFYVDALPVMVQALGQFSPTGSRKTSEWKVPAITTAVATMYWSRIIYMIGYPSSDKWTKFADTYYPATDETITSTRASLRASWLLYLVLTIQPLLTVACFVAIVFLYDTPVSKGFGLVAIIAGLDHEDMDYLKGAALSGELERPLAIKIVAADAEVIGSSTSEIKYFVGDKGGGVRSRLTKGEKYA